MGADTRDYLKGEAMLCARCGSELPEGSDVCRFCKDIPADKVTFAEPLSPTPPLAPTAQTESQRPPRKDESVRPARRGVLPAVIIALLVAGAGVGFSLFKQDGGSYSGDSSVVLEADESGELNSQSPEAPVTGNEVWLNLQATGDCFVVVRDDNEAGELLHSGSMKEGEEVSLDASKRYWLSIGDPGAVRVFINAVEYPIEGEAGIFVITETVMERVE
jgi:hypothetical protein